jgi:hypothetical protein
MMAGSIDATTAAIAIGTPLRRPRFATEVFQNFRMVPPNLRHAASSAVSTGIASWSLSSLIAHVALRGEHARMRAPGPPSVICSLRLLDLRRVSRPERTQR